MSQEPNKLGVTGVSRAKHGKYQARITDGVTRRRIVLGLFDTLEQAKAARETAEKALWVDGYQRAPK